MDLGLGTVSFGVNYGVSNFAGMPSSSEVRRTLEVAGEVGIKFIDTSPHYGRSEEILGALLGRDHCFRIVTKIPALRGEEGGCVEAVESCFLSSLKMLRQEKVYGLLIHNPEDLLGRQGYEIFRTMENFKSKGLVAKLGVSVYTEDQIEKIIQQYPIDLIQVPMNVFDQRLLKSGILKRLKTLEVEVHGRSVFLQGLVFLNPQSLLEFFSPIREKLILFQDLCKTRGWSYAKGAFAFIRSVGELDAAIIGVNSSSELVRNAAEFQDGSPAQVDFSPFHTRDERMINPVFWPPKQPKRKNHDQIR